MKGRNALKMVTVLAVISAIGIIGMLLVDGVAETFLLALALAGRVGQGCPGQSAISHAAPPPVI